MTTPQAARDRTTPALDVSFDDARAEAHRLGSGVPTGARPVTLAASLGATLASPVTAPATIPPASVSAMDGWVVAGRGPWRLDGTVWMGSAPGGRLTAGTARVVSTGAPVPAGTFAVLRSEHGYSDGVVVHATVDVVPGADVRPAGEELRAGDRVASAGSVVTPGIAAAAAVAGLDEVLVRSTPRATLVQLGDEVVHAGVPAPGQVRDAFAVPMSAALRMLGVDVHRIVHVQDDPGATRDALLDAVHDHCSDLVVSTGGTGHSGADHLVPAVTAARGRIVFRGVAVRPGHPTVLADVAGTPVLGLPGNPFAAFAALTTIGGALVSGMLASALPDGRLRIAAEELPGRGSCPRLLAARDTGSGLAATARQGAGMASALAEADVLALVAAPGIAAGAPVTAFPLPWRR
ncbi:molybdopterin molybdotransferase MoeA [Curtobacterium sp. 22159]|uniref:molybdopterin molybdotransferase MoeA n=1 Tax=Curtobacterium sp. 22159 TaxID=3453882 RepID=UPI003F85327F